MVEQSTRSPFSAGTETTPKPPNIQMLPSSATSSESPKIDMMDITSPTSTMGPPHTNSSPEMEQGTPSNGAEIAHGENTSPNQNLAAAAAAQGPKVVQTAFIHKLYNMLEDKSIQHLISWSNNNDSFVMSPSNEFSKVLAQYFKHTNISSFVRQLNMYGFHKVSDVFHGGSPDSTLWEFKHGNGNFKKGDLVGLREIKRRASRHALIHRDSFSGHKPSVSQPGTPAEPMPDTTEARLLHLEHNLYGVHARLARAEETNNLMTKRVQSLNENMDKCFQWSNSLVQFIRSMIPDPEHPINREAASMQNDIARQVDLFRSADNPHEALLSGRQPHFSNMSLDPPVSPRQAPQDESRRGSLYEGARPGMIRPPVPPHLSISPRRFGSIGGANASPNYNRSPIPPPPPPPSHPLSNVTSPPGSLARRHTSADIRQVNGWPPQQGESPYASGNSSAQWPSSPNRTPNSADQHVRDVLAQYQMGAPRRRDSRQPSPPLTAENTPNVESMWSLGPKWNRPDLQSAPPTRRSSMASNVHSLLNPADTAERADEEDLMVDERKRRRYQ